MKRGQTLELAQNLAPSVSRMQGASFMLQRRSKVEEGEVPIDGNSHQTHHEDRSMEHKRP